MQMISFDGIGVAGGVPSLDPSQPSRIPFPAGRYWFGAKRSKPIEMSEKAADAEIVVTKVRCGRWPA
jgi:hypothetical protein